MPRPSISQNDISDLVDHFRLEARCQDDHTLIFYPDRRRRNAKVQEIWTRKGPLGQGSFGIVWLYQKAGQDAGKVRAVKEIRKGMDYRQAFNVECARELYAMARLTRYPDHFAEFYGWYENNDSVFLSMEYFPCGDLWRNIHGPLAETEVQQITDQLLTGLQVVHEHGITHRDLKPQNIFVVKNSPDWWVKIGDFGISKRIGENTTYLHTIVGTKQFMAPEILDEENLEGYTKAVDIWALGCLVYLLLAFSLPFSTKKDVEQYAQGKAELPLQPLLEQDVSVAAVEFTKTLLSAHSESRPSAKDATQSPWMSIQAENKTSQEEKIVPDQEHIPTYWYSETLTDSGPAGLMRIPVKAGEPIRPSRSQHSSATIKGTMTVRDTKPKRTGNLTYNGPHVMETESDNQEEQPPGLEKFVAQPIPQVRRSNKDDVLMAAMDVTGAGRSTFIPLLTDERVEIGPDLQSSKHGRLALEYSPENRLVWAAEKGQEAVVRLLVEKGADIKAAGENGKTVLHWAAEKGQEAVVGLLLEKGADIKAADANRKTALHWAAEKGKEAVVGLLLEKGADIRAADFTGKTALHWAAEKGQEAVVRLLLARGNLGLNSYDRSGRTPLSWAAAEGHESMVRLLLSRGIVIPDSRGSVPYWPKFGKVGMKKRIVVGTPLSWAAEKGHEAVVRLLLEKGADIKAADGNGKTALHWAAEKGQEAVVRLLLEKGADIKAADVSRKTVLHWAAEKGQEAVVRLLLARDSLELNSSDRSGRTPLSWAAEKGQAAVVGLLLEKGADIKAADFTGKTALHWAAEKGHDEVVRLLKKVAPVNKPLWSFRRN